MKIYCQCGNVISDSTDNIRYKGRIVTDQEYYEFFQQVDDAMEKKTLDAVEYLLHHMFHGRFAYQCTSCGRLYVDDANNDLHEFIPAESGYSSLFEEKQIDSDDSII